MKYDFSYRLSDMLVLTSNYYSHLQMVSTASGWDEKMTEFLNSFGIRLGDVSAQYSQCCISRSTGFPAFSAFEKREGVVGQDDKVVSESCCWQSMDNLFSQLLEAVSEGEESGVYTKSRLQGYVFLLVYQWLMRAREFMSVAYHWGDMHLSGPRRLLEEIKVLFNDGKRNEWNTFYESTYFSDTNEISIEDINDYARNRKRKASANRSEANEPSTDVMDESRSKKRRKNANGTSSSTAVVASSRKVANENEVLAANGAGGSSVSAIGEDVKSGDDLKPEVSLLVSSFAKSDKELSMRCLKSILRKKENVVISEALLRIVDFYIRCILMLNQRIEATIKWADDVAKQQELLAKKSRSKSRKDVIVSSVDGTESYTADEDYQSLLALNDQGLNLGFCCSRRYHPV